MKPLDGLILAAIVGIMLAIALATRANADGCTVVEIPDSQRLDITSTVPDEQFALIRDNIHTWVPGYPFAFVSHVGDIVNHPAQGARNQRFSALFETLSGLIPWQVVPGNHDGDWTQDPIPYPEYVSLYNSTRFEAIDDPAGSLFLGTWGNDYATSSAFIFKCGSRSVLSIGLGYEFEKVGKEEHLAGALSMMEAYPDLHVMLTTHNYLQQFCGLGSDPFQHRSPVGQYLWDNLIDSSAQVFLVLSGHHTKSCTFSTVNAQGVKVAETMFNTQDEGTFPDGGDGWMNFYTIDWTDQEVRQMPYTVLYDLTAEEAGRPPHWWDTGSISPVPEPSGSLGLIVGCFALAGCASARGSAADE